MCRFSHPTALYRASYEHHLNTGVVMFLIHSDYNNAGYWSGANDITGGSLVWGDTDMPVMSSFFTNSQFSSTSYRYGRQSSSSTENAQKHCVFMKYQRSTMRMTQELSECDGGRLYICKCKTRGKGACFPPTKLEKKDDD